MINSYNNDDYDVEKRMRAVHRVRELGWSQCIEFWNLVGHLVLVVGKNDCLDVILVALWQ